MVSKLLWQSVSCGKRKRQGTASRRDSAYLEHPNVGPPPDDFKDALEYPIRKTPFSMIYRIKGNELQVLRLLDQRGGFFNERKKHP